MTVREAVKVLTEAKMLYIGWTDFLRPFDPDDDLMMDAYGDYRVKRICNSGERPEEFEISVASLPIKEVRA